MFDDGNLRDRSCLLRCSLLLKARAQKEHLYFFSAVEGFRAGEIGEVSLGEVAVPFEGITTEIRKMKGSSWTLNPEHQHQSRGMSTSMRMMKDYRLVHASVVMMMVEVGEREIWQDEWAPGFSNRPEFAVAVSPMM